MHVMYMRAGLNGKVQAAIQDFPRRPGIQFHALHCSASFSKLPLQGVSRQIRTLCREKPEARLTPEHLAPYMPPVRPDQKGRWRRGSSAG